MHNTGQQRAVARDTATAPHPLHLEISPSRLSDIETRSHQDMTVLHDAVIGVRTYQVSPFLDPRLEGSFSNFMKPKDPITNDGHSLTGASDREEDLEVLRAKVAAAKATLHRDEQKYQRKKREVQAVTATCTRGLKRALACEGFVSIQHAEASLIVLAALKKSRKADAEKDNAPEKSEKIRKVTEYEGGSAVPEI